MAKKVCTCVCPQSNHLNLKTGRCNKNLSLKKKKSTLKRKSLSSTKVKRSSPKRKKSNVLKGIKSPLKRKRTRSSRGSNTKIPKIDRN